MFLSFSLPGDVRPLLCLYYLHLQSNKKDSLIFFQIFSTLRSSSGSAGSIPGFIFAKKSFTLEKVYDNYADSLHGL